MSRITRWSRTLLAGLQTLLWTGVAFAQQSSSADSTTTTTSHTMVWHEQWWIWAVGVAIFLVVVIALTNRGGRSNS